MSHMRAGQERAADAVATRVAGVRPEHASGDHAPTMAAPPVPGAGAALAPELRRDMEHQFGHDFSRVRVHTGDAAGRSAQAMRALAFTSGPDIVFGTGRFAPDTPRGRHLLAHELAHVVQQVGTRDVQLAPDPDATGASTPAPYGEEPTVLDYAVGARKLGRLVAGAVFAASGDWQAVAMSPTAFSVGPMTSDMGSFYYVYRFTAADVAAGTYTLSRGTHLLSAHEDLNDALQKVQGGTRLQVHSQGVSPPTVTAPPTGTTPRPAGGRTPATGPQPAGDAGRPAPANPTDDVLPEFADKTAEQCREIVGDIYGGLNKEANQGILDHKIDAIYAMQTILDKDDNGPVVSGGVVFVLSLVTNAAAGALGFALPGIAANALIWGAAGAANGAVALFGADERKAKLLDGVTFCQDYVKVLRTTTADTVARVRSRLVGDVHDVRVAASAFRTLARDPGQVEVVKQNQERELLDLWTTATLAERERKRGRTVGGPGDADKLGSARTAVDAQGRIFLTAGRLDAEPPAAEHPFRWTKSPDIAIMPGVPERASQLNLDRKIGEIPVARTMRIATSLTNTTFGVGLAADGAESVQSFHGDPDAMRWVLTSFLLDKSLDPSKDEEWRQVEANWRLGVTKSWDQVRTRTFRELGISKISADPGMFGE